MTERRATADDRYRVEVDPTDTNNAHSLMLALVGSDHHVLEVGCAGGHLTEHLVARNNTVAGVEIDAASAELARRWATRVHVLDLDVERLSDVEHDTFDVIMFGDVLEHLRDPAATLTDMMTLLKPDGRVVISVPHVGHIDIRLMLLQGRWQYQSVGLLDETHLRWFTHDGLRDLLTSVGLTAVELRQVRVARFATGVEVDTQRAASGILRTIEADPNNEVFQIVVAAVRSEQTDGDALEFEAAPWLNLDAERVALEAERDEIAAHALRLEERVAALDEQIAAYENSRIGRFAAALRRARGRITRA